MSTFVLYAPTGRITACLKGTAEQANEIATQRELPVLETMLDPVSSSTHYVVDDGVLAFPTKPAEFSVWDWPLLAWVDSRSLTELKALKNSEINEARMSANRGSFEFAGHPIACDELSRSDIDGMNGIVTLTGALPLGFGGQWKADDNTYVAIPDVTTWVGMYAAMVTQGQANFVKSETLKYALGLATTAEEVAAVVWTN